MCIKGKQYGNSKLTFMEYPLLVRSGIRNFYITFNCSLHNRLEKNTHDYHRVLFEEIVDQRNSMICPIARRGECDGVENQTNMSLTTQPIPIPRQRVSQAYYQKCLGKEMKQVKTLRKSLL